MAAAVTQALIPVDYRSLSIERAMSHLQQGWSRHEKENVQVAVWEFSNLLQLFPDYFPALLGLYELRCWCAAMRTEGTWTSLEIDSIEGFIRWPLLQLQEEIRLRETRNTTALKREHAAWETLKRKYALPSYPAPESSIPEEMPTVHDLWPQVIEGFTQHRFKAAASALGKMLKQSPIDPLAVVAVHLFLRCDELFPFLYPEVSYPYRKEFVEAVQSNRADFEKEVEVNSESLLRRLAAWDESPLKAALSVEVIHKEMESLNAKGKTEAQKAMTDILRPFLKSKHPYIQYLYAGFLLEIARGHKGTETPAVLKMKESAIALYEAASPVLASAMARCAEIAFSLGDVISGGMCAKKSLEGGSDAAAYRFGNYLMVRKRESDSSSEVIEGIYCLLNAAVIGGGLAVFDTARLALGKAACKEAESNPSLREIQDPLFFHLIGLRDQEGVKATGVRALSPYSLCCEAIAAFEAFLGGEGTFPLKNRVELQENLLLAIGIENPPYLPALLLYESLLQLYPELLRIEYPYWTPELLDSTIQAAVEETHAAGRDREVFAEFPRSPLLQIMRLRYIDHLQVKMDAVSDSLFKLPLWLELKSEKNHPLFLYYLARHLQRVQRLNPVLHGEVERLFQAAGSIALAQYSLALRYDVEGKEGLALLSFKRAAEQGLTEAMSALAYRYSVGTGGVAIDLTLALRYFDEAAQLNDKEAQKDFETLTQSQYTAIPNTAIPKITRLGTASRSVARLQERLCEKEAKKQVEERNQDFQSSISLYRENAKQRAKERAEKSSAYLKAYREHLSENPKFAWLCCVKALYLGNEEALQYLPAHRSGLGGAVTSEPVGPLAAPSHPTAKDKPPRKSGVFSVPRVFSSKAPVLSALPASTDPFRPLTPSVEARLQVEIAEFKVALAARDASIASHETRIAAGEARIRELEKVVEDQRSALEAAQVAAKDSQMRVNQLEKAVAQREQDLAHAHQHAENRSAKLKERSDEIAQLKAELSAVRTAAQTAADKLAAMEVCLGDPVALRARAFLQERYAATIAGFGDPEVSLVFCPSLDELNCGIEVVSTSIFS